MKYYLAPLEGITTYVYRNAYQACFGGIDKYFTPFIVPHKNKKFDAREKKELSQEHNKGLLVVPQLLTNNAEDFVKTANDIKAMGYKEINLNLGCPSKTVVAKNKGSGFLSQTSELNKFLYDIFENFQGKISIKTRIGKESPDEFYQLIQIFNQYPIEELTIHPRIQTDYYKNIPNMEMFQLAYAESKNPICYNGDITSNLKIQKLSVEYPNLDAVMIGRGLIQNPGLLTSLTKEKLFKFHEMLLEEYILISSGDRNVLFKMKELWFYMISLFEDADKIAKKIKKCERLKDYNQQIQILFTTCELREDLR